jgi:hypothetical protein
LFGAFRDLKMNSFKIIGSALGVLVSVALIAFASEESPTTHISVMSYNIENGGAQVDFNKTAEAIKKSGADVVGTQEAWGNIARLAKAARLEIQRPAPAHQKLPRRKRASPVAARRCSHRPQADMRGVKCAPSTIRYLIGT